MNKCIDSLICPVCNCPLKHVDNKLTCLGGHSFDLAKQGYCNLLLANKKHSLQPGDNKLMVQARIDFLSKGYYHSLADSICNIINDLFINSADILDAGCGFGYYCDYISRKRNGIDNICGIDNSKTAIAKAASFNKNINYYVASVFDLPFRNTSFDVVASIFSPFAMQEYSRVLKKDGVLVIASPAPDHLWQLKQAIYDEQARKEIKTLQWNDWQEITQKRVSYQIELNNNQDILNLFSMTPYFYTTPKHKTDKLKLLNELSVMADFYITVLKPIQATK